jgi:nucleotide-binding universal stress UspA family protein
MQYLIATDSVHTSAAACDYLEDRLDPDDSVAVVTASGSNARDSEDALNAANARLLGRAELATDHVNASDDADPASAILTAAADRSVDIIIIGPHAGVPSAGPALGSTARGIIDAAEVPVVVVPLSP